VASHGTLPGRASLPRLTAPGMPHNWTQVDDELLCALVQEFFQSPHQPHNHAVQANWHFVADVLTSTGTLMGVARRPDWCKQRHVQLLKSTQDQQVSPGCVGACFCVQLPVVATCILSWPPPEQVALLNLYSPATGTSLLCMCWWWVCLCSVWA
jgi:hypothetical protein